MESKVTEVFSRYGEEKKRVWCEGEGANAEKEGLIYQNFAYCYYLISQSMEVNFNLSNNRQIIMRSEWSGGKLLSLSLLNIEAACSVRLNIETYCNNYNYLSIYNCCLVGVNYSCEVSAPERKKANHLANSPFRSRPEEFKGS